MRAWSWSVSAPDQSLFAEIFLWEEGLEAAWREAQTGGCHSRLWLELTRLREKEIPADAVPSCQKQVETLIYQKNSHGYAGAVKLRRKVRDLKARLNQADQFTATSPPFAPRTDPSATSSSWPDGFDPVAADVGPLWLQNGGTGRMSRLTAAAPHELESRVKIAPASRWPCVNTFAGRRLRCSVCDSTRSCRQEIRGPSDLRNRPTQSAGCFHPPPRLRLGDFHHRLCGLNRLPMQKPPVLQGFARFRRGGTQLAGEPRGQLETAIHLCVQKLLPGCADAPQCSWARSASSPTPEPTTRRGRRWFP
jgi:hypothetical protein